jgi:N-acetylglutamate synthase-like GNAT family acetyltransferase
MVAMRPAEQRDEEAIAALLAELDLVRPSLAIAHFWVAEEEGRVVGTAHVEPAGDALFVSSVGVVLARQHRGIASALLRRAIGGSARPAYLYTIIPDFFRQLGFVEAEVIPELPPRRLFGCDACESAKCVCMVRPPDASPLS